MTDSIYHFYHLLFQPAGEAFGMNEQVDIYEH